MAATLASITPILKEVYQGRIREQLNSEVKTLKRIVRSGSGITNETNGKYVTFPIHTRRNSGIGSRTEMQALPVPGKQGYASARLALKYAYGGIQLTGQAIALSDTDAKAFAKALDEEIDGLKRDLQVDMNRQVYGDGTGAISLVATSDTATNDVEVEDARLFQIDELVDIVTVSGPTVAVSARTVDAIDLSTNILTLSGATFNVTAGQAISRSGSYGNEITGFNSIIQDSGILYNVDPSAEPEWTSEVDDNSGTLRAISEGRMITMADRINTRGGRTSVIFQSLGVRRAYWALLSQQKQVVNELEFTGGFKGLAFTTDEGDIPVVADKDAPLNTQFFINEEALTFYRDEEWHWLDRDGSMWKQVRDASGDYDAYYARLVEYHELGADRRNTFGRVNDLLEA